jgi:REP element-mobilizing transposase RayT
LTIPRGIFAKVCADLEAELAEFDGEDDHVHLLVNILRGWRCRLS